MKKILTGLFALVLFALPASAHVVVSPSEVPKDSYQTFIMSVPSERDSATVSLKLLIPEGLQDITPTVKPGWRIEQKVTTKDNQDVVTEIDWTGGTIPAGLRDEFSFSAKVSSKGTLIWKAYQTYQDGTLISWDQASNHEGHEHEESALNPYSETMVTEGGNLHDEHGSMPMSDHSPVHDLFFSLFALALSVATLIIVDRKMKK